MYRVQCWVFGILHSMMCNILYTMSFDWYNYLNIFCSFGMRNKVCQNMRLYETKKKGERETVTGCFYMQSIRWDEENCREGLWAMLDVYELFIRISSCQYCPFIEITLKVYCKGFKYLFRMFFFVWLFTSM